MGQEIQMNVIFKGSVQGVGFRATGKYLAERLGLTGTIRNREDGSVEMDVQGAREVIDSLIQQIEDEFGPHYIKTIDKKEKPIVQKFHGFSVVR